MLRLRRVGDFLDFAAGPDLEGLVSLPGCPIYMPLADPIDAGIFARAERVRLPNKLANFHGVELSRPREHP